MYRIDENKDREKYILLIPSMLDAHFPLLKYAFYSHNYRPVILENEEGITDIGLHYVNNDMCYPAVLNAGQMIAALQSGKYDLERTRLLMPPAGVLIILPFCEGQSRMPDLLRLKFFL